MPSAPPSLSTPPLAAAPAAPAPAVQALRAWSLGLLAALVVLGLAWELWLQPIGRGTLALKVLPLVLAVAGLARHRLYTYRWLSLVAWLYAGEGALRLASDAGPSRQLAGVELALAVALFAACTLYIRRRLRAAPARTPPP